MTHTFENQTISVTIEDEIYDAYYTHAKSLEHTEYLKSGDIRFHSAEKIARGLVLSEAMSKLGNISELKKMKSEPIDTNAVMKIVEQSLVEEYLNNDCKYLIGELIMRWIGGHRMSEGMEIELANALAYAKSIIAPLTKNQFIQRACELYRTTNNYNSMDFKRALKLLILESRISHEDILEKHINDAINILANSQNMEIDYRTMKSKSLGWQINITGTLPTQIGLCRT